MFHVIPRVTNTAVNLTSSRVTLRRFLREILAKRFGILFVVGASALEREDACSLLLSSLEPWQTVRDIRLDPSPLALRAALKDDPDVVMVGEIKEGDIARETSQAALLGHLLVVTVQGIDIPRILFKYAKAVQDPFLFASSLLGVLSVTPEEMRVHAVSGALREAFMREEDVETLAKIFSRSSNG